MEEDRLVEKGTAIERDRVELFHRAEERIVAQLHVEMELRVARFGRDWTDNFADGKRRRWARAPR